MLGPLDAVAGELWLATRNLLDINISPSACPRVRLFNGHDIERWMLKVVLSSFFGGYETQSNGSKLRLPVPMGELADKLIDVPLWSNNSGLYIDTVIDHTSPFAFRTINRDDIILGAEFYMFGVRMFFLPCPVDDPKVIVPASARHRPDGFAFRVGNAVKFIAFSWDHARAAFGEDTWIEVARGPLEGNNAAIAGGRR
jgi:hypothetical protein